MNKNSLNARLNRAISQIKWHSISPVYIAAGLTLSATLSAQVTTATLGGTVADSSGAVIPKAEIVLKDEALGDVRKSVSNGSGVFTFSAVPTGTYDITITSPSFQGFEQTGIHLIQAMCARCVTSS